MVKLVPIRLKKVNSLVHIHRINWSGLTFESLHRLGIVPRTHPKINILIGAKASLRIQSCRCPPLGQQRIHTSRLKACDHSNNEPLVDHCLKNVQKILSVKPVSRLCIGQAGVIKPPPSQTPSPGLEEHRGNLG